jgi:hypothetical protein
MVIVGESPVFGGDIGKVTWLSDTTYRFGTFADKESYVEFPDREIPFWTHELAQLPLPKEVHHD